MPWAEVFCRLISVFSQIYTNIWFESSDNHLKSKPHACSWMMPVDGSCVDTCLATKNGGGSVFTCHWKNLTRWTLAKNISIWLTLVIPSNYSKGFHVMAILCTPALSCVLSSHSRAEHGDHILQTMTPPGLLSKEWWPDANNLIQNNWRYCNNHIR